MLRVRVVSVRVRVRGRVGVGTRVGVVVSAVRRMFDSFLLQ